MSGRYFTPSQAAKRYGIDYKTVLRWIYRGDLRALRIQGRTPYGDRYHIPEAELSVFEEMHSTRRSRSQEVKGRRAAAK